MALTLARYRREHLMTVENTGALLFVKEVVHAFHLDACKQCAHCHSPCSSRPGHRPCPAPPGFHHGLWWHFSLNKVRIGYKGPRNPQVSFLERKISL